MVQEKAWGLTKICSNIIRGPTEALIQCLERWFVLEFVNFVQVRLIFWVCVQRDKQQNSNQSPAITHPRQINKNKNKLLLSKMWIELEAFSSSVAESSSSISPRSSASFGTSVVIAPGGIVGGFDTENFNKIFLFLLLPQSSLAYVSGKMDSM